MITYLTDTLPVRLRGRLIMAMAAMGYLGPPATLFLMRWLTAAAPLGLEGWRWMLAIDGVGALLAGLLAWRLPESDSWRRAAESGAGARPALPRFALVGSLCFLAPWATVAFPMLNAAILVIKGFNLSDTLLYVGVSMFGPVIGSIVTAPMADRLERRTSLLICAMAMIAASIGFYVSNQPVWLMVTGFIFNLAVALYMPALTTHVAELFPARARGRATAWAWSLNRLAAALVPLVMLPWLHAQRQGLVFGTVVTTLAVTGLVVALGPRGQAGRVVE